MATDDLVALVFAIEQEFAVIRNLAQLADGAARNDRRRPVEALAVHREAE